MKAQPDVRSAPGAANGQQIKLLLVGGDDELKCNRIRRVSWTDRSWHFRGSFVDGSFVKVPGPSV